MLIPLLALLNHSERYDMSESAPEKKVEETTKEETHRTETETTPVEPEHVGDSTSDDPDGD
jgi:hypothetical protein